MDYISPASCADVAFRTMWAEFEWENKVHLFNHYCDFELCIFFLETNSVFIGYAFVSII